MKQRRDSRSNPSSQSPATHWAPVAGWYDQLVGEAGSEYHQKVVLPNTLRLLGLQTGQRALDLACGQGILCRLLADRAIDAVGVDAAADLIRAAREWAGALDKTLAARMTFHVADIRDLKLFPPDHFDAAACVLAIQNIHPIAPVFRTAAQAIKPLGRLVIVMMHPCFRGPKATSWGWDEANKVQYRRIDRYLLPRKSPIVTNPGARPDLYTWTFHRPIEAYAKALRTAGLLIDAVEEWPSHKISAAGPRASAENTARKEIPMFMAIRAVKIAGTAVSDAAALEAVEKEPIE